MSNGSDGASPTLPSGARPPAPRAMPTAPVQDAVAPCLAPPSPPQKKQVQKEEQDFVASVRVRFWAYAPVAPGGASGGHSPALLLAAGLHPPDAYAATEAALIICGLRALGLVVEVHAANVATGLGEAILTVPVENDERGARVLIEGSQALKKVFWHWSKTDAVINQRARDVCGFQGCAGKCRAVEAHLREQFKVHSIYDSIETAQEVAFQRALAEPETTQSQNLLGLPAEILAAVLNRLSAKDVAAVGGVCRALRHATKFHVRGFAPPVKLYKHQEAGLLRMVAAERAALRNVPVPLIERMPIQRSASRPGHDSDGPVVVVDLCDGSVLLLAEMPLLCAPRGGIFCDDPGLGKTITALALILKTLGQRPKAPHGCEVQLDEKRRGFYEHHPPHRMRGYGAGQTTVKNRRERLLGAGRRLQRQRVLTRAVRRPNFLNPAQGLGSVPSAHGASRIWLSSATLIVAPNLLTHHWIEQIVSKVDNDHLRYLHLTAQELATRQKSLTAQELALSYDVVVVSFEVMQDVYETMRHSSHVILSVHWMRLILDEGHVMGSTSIMTFGVAIAALRAERRWIMTGTPLPLSRGGSSSINRLRFLLRAIGERAYGCDERAWSAGVREPYAAFRLEAIDNICNVLQRVMVRTSKNRICLPACTVTNKPLEFTPAGAHAYNEMVGLAMRNMITSDFFSERHAQSLLNPKNAKIAESHRDGLRFACLISGTREIRFDAAEVSSHTLDRLYEVFRLRGICDVQAEDRVDGETHDECSGPLTFRARRKDSPDFTNSEPRPAFRYYFGALGLIGRAFQDRSAQCGACGMTTSLPLVTPCAHLLCDQCVRENKNRCTAHGCNHSYFLDKNGVPEDLLELQPAAIGEGLVSHWDKDFHSPKIQYVLDEIRRLPGHAYLSAMHDQQDGFRSKPRLRQEKIIIHSSFVEQLLVISIKLAASEFKSSYLELYGNSKRGEKAKTAVAVQRVLHCFKTDPTKSILLLSTFRGSVGHDLSMVERIYMMEPVLDPAVELQIISRAHRIGATRPIHVERLVMSRSIEESMVFDMTTHKESPEPESILGNGTIRDHERRNWLLRSLKRVVAEGKNPEETTVSCDLEVVDQQIDHDVTEAPGNHVVDEVQVGHSLDFVSNAPKDSTFEVESVFESGSEGYRHPSSASDDNAIEPQRKRVRFDL